MCTTPLAQTCIPVKFDLFSSLEQLSLDASLTAPTSRHYKSWLKSNQSRSPRWEFTGLIHFAKHTIILSLCSSWLCHLESPGMLLTLSSSSWLYNLLNKITAQYNIQSSFGQENLSNIHIYTNHISHSKVRTAKGS